MFQQAQRPYNRALSFFVIFFILGKTGQFISGAVAKLRESAYIDPLFLTP